MGIPDTKEKWTASISEVVIGATKEEGGTRTSTVTIGGSQSMPFLAYEGNSGHKPVIAVEIWDNGGENWPEELKKQYGDVMSDPAAWAKKAVDVGADLICLKLMGTHPDGGDRSPDEAAETVKTILGAVGLPLIVWGCGVEEKDNQVLPKCTNAASGENCLFGTITEKNYRTLVAACMADNQKLISESPLDINIAKQVNILARDAGFDLKNIVIFPTTGALGYGMEYVYSIMERGRLAGLGGDSLLKQPVISDVGMEAWRAKEARAEEITPELGTSADRGPLWEAMTATCLLHAGTEIIVMRHPKAIETVKKTISRMWPKS
jgi:acetyl-CoA decarbonylase/synthase complex subunit delta